eukprot:jgi/Tetstr1/426840/TSEL_017055.t1
MCVRHHVLEFIPRYGAAERHCVLEQVIHLPAYSDTQVVNTVIAEDVNDSVVMYTPLGISAMCQEPARKFRQRYIGPYPVTAKISSQAYRLRLPPTFDCHNVFHISRLRQCVNPDAQPDTIPSSVEPPVDEFVVERVIDFSIERREDLFKRGLFLVFLVRWLNYDSSHDSWEPYSALRRVDALHDFARTSRHLQDTLRSKDYANLRARHPSRFPESIPER